VTPCGSHTTASPSIVALAGKAGKASTIAGARAVESSALREKTRTRTPSRRQIIAVAVVLDLVRPLRAVGHLARERRQAGRDEALGRRRRAAESMAGR
jgi:hypothetical protein